MRAIEKAMDSSIVARIIARILVIGIILSVSSTCFAQPALADNTYVITDGDTVIFHISESMNPEQVIIEAGLRLNPKDGLTAIRTDDHTVQRQ